VTGPELPVPDDAVLVLDVDDTLYLERSYVRSGFDAVGRHLATSSGLNGVAATLWAGFEAGVRGDAFDRALVAHGQEPTAERVEDLVEVYRNHVPTIELLDDAARFLHRLDGRPAAAITDGPASSQRAKVEALGLSRWLDPIVITGELGPGWSKPAIFPYQRVEELVGALPRQCWYVGDNPAKDFIVPIRRKWTAVRIRRPGSLHETTSTPIDVHEIHWMDQLVW
jgi:putative hydrolase of the HAD superfamily